MKPLGESLARVAEAASPIVAGLFDGLSWFLDNIAGPLAKWAMECLFPAVLDVIAGAIKLIGSVLEAVKPLFLWLWDNFLEPVAKWTGGVIVSVLGWIADALTRISDWISSHQKTVETITIIIGSFAAAWGLVNVAIGIWNAVGAVASGIIKGVGLALQFAQTKAGLVTIILGALIAVIVLCIRHWDEIKAKAIECWNKIKDAWNKAGDWFRENITKPITESFTNMWANAKKIFNMGIDWIKKKFTGAINGGISLVESFINFFIKGINVLVRGIDKLSFDVPSWVPGIGGNKLGFNIPQVPQVQIPRLATGAVIPPNREFAAILGDQRHGTNIEAPEGLIRQIVREELGNVYSPVLNAINNSNLGKKAVIMGDVYMDSQKVGRVVARPVFKEGNRAGYIKVKV